MAFGGHETFAVREGWLARGLDLLTHAPQLLSDEFSEDHLGVGRNMAKSIRYWLRATGLCTDGRADDSLVPTALARLIAKRDPHFLDSGTWWALHINLINDASSAFAWNWFFNHWAIARFDRAPCVEGLRRHATSTLARTPTQRTLDREVAALLQTYSAQVPPTPDDPEDSGESPFQDLQLLFHFRATGYYQLNFDPKPIPPGVFGYAIASCCAAAPRCDFTIAELERTPSGPGRAFLLRGDELLDLVTEFESTDRKLFSLRSQAGERAIHTPPKLTALDWMKVHYERSPANANA